VVLKDAHTPPNVERPGDAMILLEQLTRSFEVGGVNLPVLKGLDLMVPRGEFLSILGPSGCGKSTLLNILGLLDRPSDGAYRLDNQVVQDMDDARLSTLRNRKIGFVFQGFNLLGRLTARENVELPLIYRGENARRRMKRSMEMLDRVGLADRADHKPSQLSGGQQQRAAIARALVGDPAVLLADEPTGALDSKVGSEIIELFLSLNRDMGLTIIMITHDRVLARRAARSLYMVDGLLGQAPPGGWT
jgi:putative ABC transport system ATP-binding protein